MALERGVSVQPGLVEPAPARGLHVATQPPTAPRVAARVPRPGERRGDTLEERDSAVAGRDAPRGQTVLHVEDHPADAMLFAHMLRGVRPETVIEHRTRLGDVTPELAAACQCSLLDLSLPDASGLDAVRLLRERAPELPIIVLTGLDDVDLGVEALRNGAQDYLLKDHVDGLELDRAIRYSVERHRLEMALAHQAFHDPLTGLGNRALFRDRLELAQQRATRTEPSLGLVLLDLDHFKEVNDTLGHVVGDQLLVALTERLRRSLRPGDTLCRLGGDEFAVIREGLALPEHLEALARRLLHVFDEPLPLPSGPLSVSASCGVALAGADWQLDDLLRDVDTAMYAAKRLGRNRIEWFDQTLREEVLARFARERALRESLTHGRGFWVTYQEVIDLETGKPVGMEALARWSSPGEGLVPPDEFIPLAVSTGLIADLDKRVFRTALFELARRRERDPGLTVSVNVTDLTLRSDGFEDLVTGFTHTLGIPPHAVILELVESSILGGRTRETLARLRALGFRVALDDFGAGAGAASLTHFLTLSADIIKLDKSFVQEAARGSERAAALLSLLVAAGEAAGMTLVAEGIEGEEELAVCRELGVHQGQGFLWGRM